MAHVLLTAIVAVYNEERRLAECLDSLLRQTYQPLEILVADDGSSDGTRDVAARYPTVRLLAGAHRGKARTVNEAVSMARGAIVLFLDGDMYFDPRYVETLVAPILSGETIGTCHALEHVANATNRWSRCWQVSAGLPVESRLRLSAEDIARGSIVFRAVVRDEFLRVDGFEDTGYNDDQTLSPKLGRRAVFVLDAACHHYNLESLREVFAQGRWGGKTIHLKHGARALLRYALPLSLWHAVRAAARTRMLAMLPYRLVSDAGVFCTLVERSLAHGEPGR